MAFWDNTNRNETFRGTDEEYDQVDYAGALLDYRFIRNADGSVTASHPTFGTDTLISIDGFWFGGEQAWYSIDDAIRLTAEDVFIDEFGVITGNAGNNTLRGTAGVQDLFYGGMGNDRFIGGGDEYDQVEYDGELIEYTFTQNANGNVIVSHPTWGRDVLTDIDGFWFIREGAWYSVEDALELTADLPRFRLDADDVLNGTPGNDNMVAELDGTNFYGGTGNDTYRGRNDAYDQVNYDGDFADYSFSLNANGSVTAVHNTWGVDTLFDIDGIYFNGPNGGWMSIEDVTTTSQAPVSAVLEDQFVTEPDTGVEIDMFG